MNNKMLIRKLILKALPSLQQGIGRVLWAQHCLLCGVAANTPCCDTCVADLPRLETPACPICAHPLLATRCPACRQHPISLDQSVAAFAYDYPLNHLVQALKYRHQLALGQWLAAKLLPGVLALHQNHPVDALIAMPLHPRRLAHRGFNQSQEIACYLAAHLQRPVLTRHCHRLLETVPQVELQLAQRRALPANMFSCEADLLGQHILLVDDVMTTGSSLDRLARSIRQQGAQRVSCAVLARTLFD